METHGSTSGFNFCKRFFKPASDGAILWSSNSTGTDSLDA